MENQQRDAALLTQAQRGLIRGEKSYSQASEREIRKRIRYRMYNSVLDLALIAREFPVEQTRKAFTNPPDNTTHPPDAPRIQTSFPAVLRLFVRGIIADYPDRRITDAHDFVNTLEPVITNFEKSIEGWLNAQRQMTADFELSMSVNNIRSIESLIDELEARPTPVTGQERLEISATLDRAGIASPRISDLIGDEPDEDADPEASNYSTEELAALPPDKLGELLASGIITVDEQTAALEEKYGDD